MGTHRLGKESSDRSLTTPEEQRPGHRGSQNNMPLMIAKHGIRKSPGANKATDDGQMDSMFKRKLKMPGQDTVLSFDPKKYPTGRISRAFIDFSGSDWMCKTLLVHRMVSVVQAVIRGATVRKWFRASLMEASSRITDRAYFKRLAGIGYSSGMAGAGGDGMDFLAQQVREEEESDALGTIRRNRRDGDVALGLEGVKLLEQRFTRIGKEKAQSGHAYKEMTEHVIATGMPRRKTKSVVLITATHFIPPCVHFNPFAQREIACPEEKNLWSVDKACAVLKGDNSPGLSKQRAVSVFLASSRRGDGTDCTNTPNIADPAPDDLSVSDWTDFDEEEFDSLPVWAHLGIVKSAPIHHLSSEQAAEGERQTLLHGHYRTKCKVDSTAAQKTLEALETRIARIRAFHSEEFDPECMELPANVVQDLLVQKFASNTARLKVPLYKSVQQSAGSPRIQEEASEGKS